MKTILVTGANGFIGRRFMTYKADQFHLIPVSLRSIKPTDLDLRDVDVVLHLAVVAHDPSKTNDNIQYRVNFEMTRELAHHAKGSGVKQFIFMSSVKVYGEGSEARLDESSGCHPVDAYGKSKLMAEQYLQSIAEEEFKVAIIRPPLVYGPEVKGNMLRMLKLAKKSIPLPLGHTRNPRSIVFIDNLMELIHHLIASPTTGIFIAGDWQPWTTDQIVTQIRSEMGQTSNLVSLPRVVRNLLKSLKPGIFNRLFGSFVIDNSNTNRILNFTPPFSTEFGIRVMTSWFLQQQSSTRS